MVSLRRVGMGGLPGKRKRREDVQLLGDLPHLCLISNLKFKVNACLRWNGPKILVLARENAKMFGGSLNLGLRLPLVPGPLIISSR